MKLVTPYNLGIPVTDHVQDGHRSGEVLCMNIHCASCGQNIEFSDRRPSFCAYCGKALPASTPDATAEFSPNASTDQALSVAPLSMAMPDRIGDYRMVRRLGRGGMGDVFEAEDTRNGRRVALKRIRSGASASETDIDRFRREGRVASQIHHPNVVFVYSADEADGQPYIVMELMPGQNLKDVVDAQGPLPFTEAITHTLDIADGLIEAHRQGVVHRDVKPSNCFLDHDGRVKIGDFGLSKTLDKTDHLTQTGVFMGTALFASLEQVRGDKVDEQSDLYSVAATLYYLLRGRAPYHFADSASTLARLATDPIPSILEHRPELPKAFDEVLKRGLERDRSKRFQTLREFRDAVAAFLPSTAAPPPRSIRFAALAVDYLFSTMIMTVVVGIFRQAGRSLGLAPDWYSINVVTMVAGNVVPVVYFSTFERWMQATPAKWIFGLRVAQANGIDPPTFWQTLMRNVVFRGMFLVNDLAPVLFFPGQDGNVGWVLIALVSFTYGGMALAILLGVSTMRRASGYRGIYEWASGTRVVLVPPRERTALFRAPAEGPPIRQSMQGTHLGPFAIRGKSYEDSIKQVLLGDELHLARAVMVIVGGAPAPSLRRDLVRRARQRWLAGGVEDGKTWDAYLLPKGQTLRHFVTQHGPMEWGDFRPILEALIEEIAAAESDESALPYVSVEQVWLQEDGRPVLLEMPIQGDPDASPSAPMPAHDFLRAVVTTALRPVRGSPVDSSTIDVPLPMHAKAWIDELLFTSDRQPSMTKLTKSLQSLRDRPTHLTKGRRLGALLLSAVFTLLGMLTCFGGAFFSGAIGSVASPKMDVTERTIFLAEFERRSIREILPLIANPDPSLRLVGLARYRQDLNLAKRLRERLDQKETLLKRRLPYASLPAIWFMEAANQQHEIIQTGLIPSSPGPQFRGRAEYYSREQDSPARFVLHSVSLIQIGFFPIVMAALAFVFRGGFVKMLLGVCLVNSRVERAGRFRCAWRSLLLWVPVTILFGLGISLEFNGWQRLDQGTLPSWQMPLATVLMLLSLAIPIAHAVSAMAMPKRSPLDFLSGSHLVPE